MEYNTTRSKLLMPEYGRNVQKMVEYLVTVDDREKRLKQAEVIIELMGTLNPPFENNRGLQAQALGSPVPDDGF